MRSLSQPVKAGCFWNASALVPVRPEERPKWEWACLRTKAVGPGDWPVECKDPVFFFFSGLATGILYRCQICCMEKSWLEKATTSICCRLMDSAFPSFGLCTQCHPPTDCNVQWKITVLHVHPLSSYQIVAFPFLFEHEAAQDCWK